MASFFYLILMMCAFLTALLVVQYVNQDDAKFRIGIVDHDNSAETQLILNSMGNGTHLGKDIRIQRYNPKSSAKIIESTKIRGYYVFEKGMTKTFYKHVNLPIAVYTYDQTSLKV